MYGFWRLGLSPRPSAGAVCVAKGLATKTRSSAKNDATPPRTGTVHGRTSVVSRRLSVTAAGEGPVRTGSQRGSDPPWPPQKAGDWYGNGSALLEGSATTEKEETGVGSGV